MPHNRGMTFPFIDPHAARLNPHNQHFRKILNPSSPPHATTQRRRSDRVPSTANAVHVRVAPWRWSSARQQNHSARQPRSFARQQNDSARQPSSSARQQNRAARQQNDSSRQPSSSARQPSSSARQQNLSARQRRTATRQRSDPARHQRDPTPHHRPTAITSSARAPRPPRGVRDTFTFPWTAKSPRSLLTPYLPTGRKLEIWPD